MTEPNVHRYLKNLRVERDNEALYARLAAVASDPRLARAYRRIADGERANAAFWESRLRDIGAEVPAPHPRTRVRVLGALATWFGTGFVMPTVVRLEHADHLETPVDRTGHRDHFVPADGRARRPAITRYCWRVLRDWSRARVRWRSANGYR
jgi:hypothetical protein